MGRVRFVLAVLLGSLTAAACGATAAPTSAPSTAPPASAAAGTSAKTGDFDDEFDIGGYKLYLSCQGTGSPTVILEAGLAGSPFVWSSVQDKLGKTTRTCSYARAGIGPSDGRPRSTFSKEGVSTGFMVDETWKLLHAAGLTGPFVMVGHSYGGLLVQLFSFRHSDQVAGVVLVDSSSVHQYEGEWLANDKNWEDGSTLVNREASATELKAVTSLGSTPLVVLTQSELSGDFEVDWSHFQDELATLSTNSLHMIAYPSGHMIMNDQEALLVDSVKAVVESAASHATLPACAPRFSALQALCLQSTMTAQLDAWTAERAAIKPAAGSFPAWTYLETLTAADVAAVNGNKPDFEKAVNTWVFMNGHWSVSILVDKSSAPELHEGTYAEAGGILTLVIPVDWKTPMTSGVYKLRWTKDADGTIHFDQTDNWPKEPDWAVPYIRVGPAT